jgi:hypothetical protein
VLTALFLENLKEWVAAQPNVVGAALVGSHARGAAPEESDIDVMILTTVVEKYFLSDQWSSLFGQVQFEHWGVIRTLRSFYRDGREIEFNFASPDWACVPVDPGTHRVVSDGMHILFDPQDVFGSVQRTVLGR